MDIYVMSLEWWQKVKVSQINVENLLLFVAIAIIIAIGVLHEPEARKAIRMFALFSRDRRHK